MEEITEERLKRALRYALKVRNITIAGLAAKTGIPYRTLQNQVVGVSRLSAINLIAIMAATDMPVGNLIDGGDEVNLEHLELALGEVFKEITPEIFTRKDGTYYIKYSIAANSTEHDNRIRELAAVIAKYYGIYSLIGGTEDDAGIYGTLVADLTKPEVPSTDENGSGE